MDLNFYYYYIIINVKLSMDENTVFSFYNESVVCVQFIAESLVNLDKRNTNKGIVLHKKLRPFLYICILSLVLQIYPKIYICI